MSIDVKVVAVESETVVVTFSNRFNREPRAKDIFLLKSFWRLFPRYSTRNLRTISANTDSVIPPAATGLALDIFHAGGNIKTKTLSKKSNISD
jgi:hypothetical protein